MGGAEGEHIDNPYKGGEGEETEEEEESTDEEEEEERKKERGIEALFLECSKSGSEDSKE